MKQLQFFSPPLEQEWSSSELEISNAVQSQDAASFSTITVINARHPKQKLHCYALIEPQDPTQVFLVVFDKKASSSLRSSLLEGSKVDYVQFILTQVYQPDSIQATYNRLNKLYVDELHTDITRELITRCILAKSNRKRYDTVKKELSVKPIKIIVPHDFFASIAFQHPIQNDPTVASRAQTFPLPKKKPDSAPESILFSDDELAECFADIDVAIDTDEYDTLTLALAFNVLTPEQQDRLDELRLSQPELNDVMVEWAEHLRLKYIDKGFTFTQVKQIHNGDYEEAGVFKEENELTILFDLLSQTQESHHVSDM